MCDIKTHISHKQIGQMLIYLGQQQRLELDEAICNVKYGIIVFFCQDVHVQENSRNGQNFHGKKQCYIQQWISTRQLR